MMYPLVRELAVDGIPVTVACRVLKIARQPYYRWLGDPVTYAELEQAYLANALFDAHSTSRWTGGPGGRTSWTGTVIRGAQR